MSLLSGSNPSSLSRSVSFNNVLAFQSPPAVRRSRHLSTSASDHKRSRTPRTLFSSSSSSSASAPVSDSRKLSRHSSQPNITKSHGQNHRHRHRSKHHRHHHHHRGHRHHRHSVEDSDKENALVAHAGATPGKRPGNCRPLRERIENMPAMQDMALQKKTHQCSHSHCHQLSHIDAVENDLPADIPYMFGARNEYVNQLQSHPAFVPVAAPYNVEAQNKYSAQLQNRHTPSVLEGEHAQAQPTFYPSLEPYRDQSAPYVARPAEISPLERIAFLEENGAKAHLHRFVFFHLQLNADEGWEEMLQGLDGAQLHALYAFSRGEPSGLTLLKRAEAEEREVARLHVSARQGLGQYAVARILADERRATRIARLSLRRFLESEGGIWTEEHGVQRAVIAMGRRIERLRDYPGASA